MNILLFFLVFSSIGGFPIWKILVIFHGQDVFLSLYRIYLQKSLTKIGWEFIEVFMITLFGVFYLLIVFVNHHDYFGNNDDAFYINIFEINFAAIMMRWGN